MFNEFGKGPGCADNAGDPSRIRLENAPGSPLVCKRGENESPRPRQDPGHLIGRDSTSKLDPGWRPAAEAHAVGSVANDKE